MSLYTDRNWCATNSRQVPFFTSALFNIKALARIGCMPVLFIISNLSILDFYEIADNFLGFLFS